MSGVDVRPACSAAALALRPHRARGEDMPPAPSRIAHLVRQQHFVARAQRRLASTATPPAPQGRRARFDLGLIGLAGIAVSGLVIWSSRRSKDDSSKMGQEDDRPAFTIPYESQ